MPKNILNMDSKLKNEIAERSDNGLFFFKMIIKCDLIDIGSDRFKNVKNPFYDDKTASFSIYKSNNGKWCFKDYGNIRYSGDYHDLCAIYYNIDVKKDFLKLLHLMIDALNNSFNFPLKQKIAERIVSTKSFVGVKLYEVEFSDSALNFWKKYGITNEILKLNNVVQINGYMQEYEGDVTSNFTNLGSHSYFAYKMLKSAKIYCPNPKSFRYVGKKPKNYVFGQNYDNGSNLIFLAGGEKDVMTLHALGFQAICLNSETSLPSNELLRDFYEGDIVPVVLYDCDKTGRECSNMIVDRYKWNYADLSKIVPVEVQSKVKDISDYVSNHLSIEKLKIFLNEFQNSEITNIVEEKCSEVSETEDIEDIEYFEEIDEVNKIKSDSYLPIPEKVYDNLPPLLKMIVEKISKSHKKDLVLTGSLVVLSDLISVKGVYSEKEVFPNLYLFITAPASAGKSALSWVRKLGCALNKRYDFYYKSEFKAYIENNRMGEKPQKQSVFVSANASIAALLNQIHVNEGRGIMLETEADALNDVMKNQWGNLSDVLRRCHEFEPLSSLRADSEKSFSIEKPRLSIVLTGTKDQLFELIPSAQNGLFSRFLFFEFPLIKTWENVFEKKESLDGHYNSVADKVLDYHDKTTKQNLIFELTDAQGIKFNAFYEQKQNEYDFLLGENSIASVRRIAGMQFRIAMLLGAIRSLDQGSDKKSIICSDVDFEISHILASWFLNHTRRIYTQLPNKPKQFKELKTNEAVFLERLPNPFSFKEALQIADSLVIPKGTCENMLRRFNKLKMIEKLAHGKYSKI